MVRRNEGDKGIEEGIPRKKIRGTVTKPSRRKTWYGWVGEKNGQGEGSEIKKGYRL